VWDVPRIADVGILSRNSATAILIVEQEVRALFRLPAAKGTVDKCEDVLREPAHEPHADAAP
jgi:hypothetical protein